MKSLWCDYSPSVVVGSRFLVTWVTLGVIKWFDYRYELALKGVHRDARDRRGVRWLDADQQTRQFVDYSARSRHRRPGQGRASLGALFLHPVGHPEQPDRSHQHDAPTRLPNVDHPSAPTQSACKIEAWQARSRSERVPTIPGSRSKCGNPGYRHSCGGGDCLRQLSTRLITFVWGTPHHDHYCDRRSSRALAWWRRLGTFPSRPLSLHSGASYRRDWLDGPIRTVALGTSGPTWPALWRSGDLSISSEAAVADLGLGRGCWFGYEEMCVPTAAELRLAGFLRIPRVSALRRIARLRSLRSGPGRVPRRPHGGPTASVVATSSCARCRSPRSRCWAQLGRASARRCWPPRCSASPTTTSSPGRGCERRDLPRAAFGGLAAVNTALTVGTITGPALAGMVVHSFGYSVALFAAAAIVALAAAQAPPAL